MTRKSKSPFPLVEGEWYENSAGGVFRACCVCCDVIQVGPFCYSQRDGMLMSSGKLLPKIVRHVKVVSA